jgi:ActR/RegA family two-component response regulator
MLYMMLTIPQPRGNPTLNAIAELNDLADRSLLIVEDDKPFLERLSRAMETRGFAVTSCDTVSDGLAQINKAAPAFAVVDLRLGDGNGLDVVSALKRKRPDARTIVLTGYGNIATAVTAVKMGAVDYLSKPATPTTSLRRCSPAAPTNPSCRPIRCRRIACAGNTSSASTRCATATSRRPRGG